MILSRHGNTFSPGDKIIRAGSGEDLSLVERGIEQAQLLAQEELLITEKYTYFQHKDLKTFNQFE